MACWQSHPPSINLLIESKCETHRQKIPISLQTLFSKNQIDLVSALCHNRLLFYHSPYYVLFLCLYGHLLLLPNGQCYCYLSLPLLIYLYEVLPGISDGYIASLQCTYSRHSFPCKLAVLYCEQILADVIRLHLSDLLLHETVTAIPQSHAIQRCAQQHLSIYVRRLKLVVQNVVRVYQPTHFYFCT